MTTNGIKKKKEVSSAAIGQESASSRKPVCLDCPVQRSGFCCGFNNTGSCNKPGRTRTQTILAGMTLSVKDNPAQIAIVFAGFLRICRQRIDGHRQIIRMLCPGELVELSQITDYVEIEAATDARICWIHPDSAADHKFRQTLLAVRQQMTDQLRDHVWALGSLRPAARVALLLLRSCNCMPWQPLPSGGGILTMQLSRPDIAAYLGTTVETLCRVISKLDDMGLIRTHSARHFEIPDILRLGHFARTERLKEVDPISAFSTSHQCELAGVAFK